MTEVRATCPCCGAAVDPLALFVDLETNTIASGGFAHKVKPQHAEFAHVIATAYPRAVTVDRLRAALWGMGDEPETSLQSIRVMASKIRAVLRDLGFDLVSVGPNAYRMERAASTSKVKGSRREA